MGQQFEVLLCEAALQYDLTLPVLPVLPALIQHQVCIYFLLCLYKERGALELKVSMGKGCSDH